MEKFNYPMTQTEQEPGILPEKIKRTNTVLAKLALWGVIAFNPLQATENKTPELDNRDDVSIEQISKEDASKKVRAFENRFKESGLISMEEQHEKPVVVVMSKKNIENNYSEAQGFIKTEDDFLTESLILNFVNDDVDVVERGTSGINAILKEAKLGEEGLVEPGQVVKLGNWSSADYYVVSSVKNNESGSFVLKNEIINMKDGSISEVEVESSTNHSDEDIARLAEKTRSVIQKAELQKHE